MWESIEMAVAMATSPAPIPAALGPRIAQFRVRKVQHTLTRHQTIGSEDEVASASDNAAMESLFALLQKNVLNRQSLGDSRLAPHQGS